MIARDGLTSWMVHRVVAWCLLRIPPRHSFLSTHLQLLLRESRLPELGSQIGDGLDYDISTAAATSRVVIRSVAFPLYCPFVSALLRGSCGARRLRSFCFAFGPVPVLAPPFRSPRKSSF